MYSPMTKALIAKELLPEKQIPDLKHKASEVRPKLLRLDAFVTA
jgi:hypothetical protein